MKYVLDVQYNGNENAVVACLGFKNWEDEKAVYAKQHFIEEIMPYVPGEFYQRELPCLLLALKELEDIECLVVDGYVWLTDEKKGLGAYLYEALNQKIPVIGVAKNWFKDNTAIQVLRGESKKPLFVTAAGFDAKIAAKKIEQMDGAFRNPTILKQVDQLCRAW